NSVGPRRGAAASPAGGNTNPVAGTGFGRGDDFAIITSLEVTPIKGLDLRPTYAFVQITGSGVRRIEGGLANPAFGTCTTQGGLLSCAGSPFTRGGILGVGGLGLYEARHTIGIDARWRFGPFSLDPTFYYQWGHRDVDNPWVGPGSTNATVEAKESAFFF